MKSLKPFFLITDIGFILYWTITTLHIIPDEYLFKDYYNPVVAAWNWSFMPLDLFISITGLTSLYLYHRKNPAWSGMALASLVLTFCSGLMAIAFWGIKGDFDIGFWIPNLYLLIYPFFFFKRFIFGETVLQKKSEIET
ncbi:MAG: YvaD family protein [Clostridia bacterium]|nr:YvaD family protein [Clostridia bacterium]